MDLARIFHEVARRGGARQAFIALVGEEAVQRVAEFVEGGVHPVEADQLDFACRCLRDVEHVVDHRLGAIQMALLHEVAHPCTATLGRALERVEIEDAQFAAVAVEDGVGRHIRVIDRQVRALLEGKAVKLFGHVEHAVLEHLVEHEVFHHRIFIEVELFGLDAVGIAIPVPRLHFVVAAVGSDCGGQQGRFTALGRGKGRDHLFHEIERGLRLFGHAIPHGVAGPVGFTEQRRLVGAQLGDLGDQHARVDIGRAVGAVIARHEQLFAGSAVFHARQQRLLRRVLQRDGIFAVEALFGRQIGSGLDVVVRQTGELFAGVEDHRLVAHCRAGGLAELGRQRRELRVDRLDLLALGIAQQRAGMDHGVVGGLEQLGVFHRHRHRGAIVIDGLHAGEECGVERDRVIMLGQLGADLGVDLVEAIGRVRTGEGEEDRVDPPQHAAGLFQRDDGVFEIRGVRVVLDRLDLGLVDHHRLLVSGQVIVFGNLGEVRRVKRQVAAISEIAGASGNIGIVCLGFLQVCQEVTFFGVDGCAPAKQGCGGGGGQNLGLHGLSNNWRKANGRLCIRNMVSFATMAHEQELQAKCKFRASNRRRWSARAIS